MIIKLLTFLFAFTFGVFTTIPALSVNSCANNTKLALFNEEEAKLLKNRKVITFERQFACFRGDLNRDCIDVKSDSIGQIIGYKPIYQIDEKTELETKNIEGYKLIVKWENIDSNYTSYYFKKSYFVGDKEYPLNQILEK